MFGLVVPGRPCFGDFAQVAENRWFAQIPDKINNQSISEVTLFILPGAGASIPPQIGFTIYISKDSQNWEYLDFLSAEKQSTHAHMPLSFGSSSSSASLFQGFAQQQQTDQSFIFIGISVESMDTINNLSVNAQNKQQMELNQVQQLVQFIAKDLFNFMSSFTKPIQFQQGMMKDMLILPTNCIDQWLQKFLSKLRNNPHCKYYHFIPVLTIAYQSTSGKTNNSLKPCTYSSSTIGFKGLKKMSGQEVNHILEDGTMELFDIERLCEIHQILSKDEILALIEAHVLQLLILLNEEGTTADELLFRYDFGKGDIMVDESGSKEDVLKTSSGIYTLKRKKKSNNSKKNHLVWSLMADVYALISLRKKITQRELFYMNVNTFKDQIQCNRYLSNLGDVLNVDRSLLNIITMSKGYMYSNCRGNSIVSLQDSTHAIVESIPGDFPENISFNGDVDTVIIVEKDAIFRRLVEDKVFKWIRNVVVVTGCGYPSVITRYVIHQIADRYPKARLFALCDFNIFGFQIMSTYKNGSVELSKHSIQHLSFIGDRLEWLGLHFEDVKDLPPMFNQAVTSRELSMINNHINDIKSKKQTSHSQLMIQQLEMMKSLKFEIESLISTHGFDFLTKFISKKLFNSKN